MSFMGGGLFLYECFINVVFVAKIGTYINGVLTFCVGAYDPDFTVCMV